MKAAIYCRVSTEEQTEGFSLDAQKDACRAFAESRKWSVVEEYIDPGYSGKSDHRPAFKRMIYDIQAGKIEGNRSGGQPPGLLRAARFLSGSKEGAGLSQLAASQAWVR